jgi:RHS repeat-associated protein
MVMPEREYYTERYRFGYNGKESDNEVKGIAGSQQDYGMRIYDPRLGKFLSVDPITKEYPELTPYQFASNCPISGVDKDGLEYYYAADGTLLWTHGESTQVMLVNDEFAAKNKGKTVSMKDLNANSTSVGITNGELNLRAFLYTIRNTEGQGTTLPYDIQFGGGKFGKGKDDKEKYKDHPRKAITKWNKTSTAAGAYEILAGTFDAVKGKVGVTDFTPESQDKLAVYLIKRRGALEQVKSANLDDAFKTLKNEWSSLPGAKEQGMKLDDAKATFKKGLAKELTGTSDIATPKSTSLSQ